jgi:hypothetical protein
MITAVTKHVLSEHRVKTFAFLSRPHFSFAKSPQ